MLPRRMLPSDPDYETYDNLWNLYAISKNPQIFVNENDLENYQIQDIMNVLENNMQDLLDGLPVVFLNGLSSVEADD